MSTRSTPRSQKLDLRLTAAAKRTLQVAARAQRRSVSDLVLESALARADEALADRTRFGFDAARWEAFLAALDAPTQTPPPPRLEPLFGTAGVFEAPSTHE